MAAHDIGGGAEDGRAKAEAGHAVEAGGNLEGELARYVRVYFDNTGTRAELTSVGWKGGTMLWEGRLDARDGSAPVRSIVERTSDESFQVRWQRLDGDGWVTRRTEVYRRR